MNGDNREKGEYHVCLLVWRTKCSINDVFLVIAACEFEVTSPDNLCCNAPVRLMDWRYVT